MLLFSTLLEIDDKMSKEDFVRLVIEWNQKSPHKDNIIPELHWNKEYNVRYGSDNMWLSIKSYKDIVAIRYENVEKDGVVWDTDFVMNFSDMKLAIQLDRSYLEEALTLSPSFSTPYFISMLIEHGYIKRDQQLRVQNKPFIIGNSAVEMLADIINGNGNYHLPIVYVSKTYDDEDPVDVWRLASRLKGVAHILVQEGTWINQRLRRLCDSKNEYYGAVGIYIPNRALQPRRFLYRKGKEFSMTERVIRSVIQYSNSQKINTLYSWQGVNNAILKESLNHRREELNSIKSEKMQAEEEAYEMIESLDDDIQALKNQIESLEHANEALLYENQGLRTKLSQSENIPVLYLGEEEDLFPDEIKAILLDALEDALPAYDNKVRRKDVILDIIKYNDCKRTANDRAKKMKQALKGYKNVNTSLKRDLQDIGFYMEESNGKHYKLTYYHDPRYTATLAKTPSDDRSGTNFATTVMKFF